MAIKTALVVDDSKSAGLMLRRMLEQNNLSVDLTESGEAAIAYLRAKIPDVIFMDHIMPGMNGLDAAKTIVSDPRTAAVPIVMYTSKEGDSYLEQARAHGAVAILPKPAKQATLARILQDLNAAPAAPAPVAAAAPPPSAAAPGGELLPESLQPMLTRAIADQLAAAKQEILARTEESARSAAATYYESQTRELAAELGRFIREQVAAMQTQVAEQPVSLTPGMMETVRNAATLAANAQVGEVARQAAAEVFQGQIPDLLQQLKRSVEDQITEAKAELAGSTALSPAMFEQVRELAASIAAESASKVARETATQAAGDLAKQAAHAAAKNAAAEHYNIRSAELISQFKGYVNEQLHEVKATLAKSGGLPPNVLEEVKQLARSAASQRATEAARREVQDLSPKVFQDIAKQAANVSAREIVEETIQNQMGVVYGLVGLAAAVGVLAAIASYFLK